ncbi:hypothetical protein E2C01_041238 [Portunus trituberculatus]|uniref:Uncharacterized protein n=1 Tax=Portunus trituberculatus TaxID=210409 RepID=A0A5B7FIP9_PORTR|nr:hypothetical protein [Portunus trituberculatus]
MALKGYKVNQHIEQPVSTYHLAQHIIRHISGVVTQSSGGGVGEDDGGTSGCQRILHGLCGHTLPNVDKMSWCSGTMRALGSEGSPSARVPILSTV